MFLQNICTLASVSRKKSLGDLKMSRPQVLNTQINVRTQDSSIIVNIIYPIIVFIVNFLLVKSG